MGKSWKIGDISFTSKEEYRAGKRDLEQIKKLLAGTDLDDPIEVKELYHMLKGRPFLFESEVGTAFKIYLQEKSFGDSAQKSARSSLQDRYEEASAGSSQKGRYKEASAGRSSRMDKYTGMDAGDGSRISKDEVRSDRRRKNRRPKGRLRKRLLTGAGIVAGVALMLFGLWQIFSYDIRSYISEKKMEEIISCILVPYDATVSDAHRIADLIASGLYTEQEAVQKVQQEKEQQETADGEKKILYQYSVLYERNQDMAGWIRLDGTVLNYPVMLTPEEEEYYLKRDFDKGSDLNGLPFMDARCTLDTPVSNYLIHGHNMKNGSMFSCLLKYEEQTFYEEHRQIYFDTIYDTGVYEILGVFQTRVAYEGEDTYRYYSFINADNAEEYDEYIRYVKENSFYETGVTAEYGEQLITLSTCDRRIEDGRFVVVAKKCR